MRSLYILISISTSTEQNCQNLERVYRAYKEWASRHGSAFDPKKYDLIYFSRTLKRFNMLVEMNILSFGYSLKPKADIRVLGV
jgi:hypothetical protein